MHGVEAAYMHGTAQLQGSIQFSEKLLDCMVVKQLERVFVCDTQIARNILHELLVCFSLLFDWQGSYLLEGQRGSEPCFSHCPLHIVSAHALLLIGVRFARLAGCSQ